MRENQYARKFLRIRKKAIKQHFKKITQSGIMDKKEFWSTITPFIKHKNGVGSSSIMINENDKIITESQELAELFNKH